MADTTKHEPMTVYIRPTSGLAALNLSDFWVYRELVYFMVWRDLKVRYKQTLLGVTWVVIQPVLTMLAFTFIFGRVAKLPSDGVPYPVFSYVALLPWGLFSTAINNASRSLITSHNMITKVYFPRMIMPIASVLGGLVDFGIAFLVLLALMAYYGIVPTSAVWTLPLFIILALVTSQGIGLWLSAVNVKYRDVNYALPFLTQFMLFLSPVAYSVKTISAKWQLVYALNPMSGVINGFRWALLGNQTLDMQMLLVSSMVAIFLLISGLFYFRSMEKTFADTI